MIIDFHTHTFPDRIASRAIAGMQANSHAAAFGDGTLAGLRASGESKSTPITREWTLTIFAISGS